MKIVINCCYGGFCLSDECARSLGVDCFEAARDYLPLVEAVEKDAKRCAGLYSELKIAEIPDEATDWIIQDYDGLENVIYVIDGKIHHAW